MHPYVGVLQTYMTALGQGDYATIKGLFAPGGKVRSPFLGEMPAGPFFDRLADASTRNVITPIDIFLSTSDQHHASRSKPAAGVSAVLHSSMADRDRAACCSSPVSA